MAMDLPKQVMGWIWTLVCMLLTCANGIWPCICVCGEKNI